jgi:2-keto-4-pentenoate hydratase/2-oxohepta-3-ene-1,7-dioic acid hydratase in catechol pathway
MRLAVSAGELALIEGGRARDVTRWAFATSPVRTEDPLIAFIRAHNAGATPEGPPIPMPSRFAAPLSHPGKIVAAAANYRKHTLEMNPGEANPGGIREKGFFLKAPSSIIGPGEAIRLPFADRRTDHEAELAVVIGRGGRAIPAERVADHIFGYTCLLDITVRGKEDRGLRKSFDTFTPMGPWVVTREEIPGAPDLEIVCRVNGTVRQQDRTSAMILPVAELVSWISHVMTLEPGDVIATGTPAGVGPLAPGDRVAVEIERIGGFEVSVEAA